MPPKRVEKKSRKISGKNKKPINTTRSVRVVALAKKVDGTALRPTSWIDAVRKCPSDE